MGKASYKAALLYWKTLAFGRLLHFSTRYYPPYYIKCMVRVSQGLCGTEPPRETRELAVFINGNMGTWELEQILPGNQGAKCILGGNSAFLFKEHSKKIFGNKGDTGNLSREHGSAEPTGRASMTYNK